MTRNFITPIRRVRRTGALRLGGLLAALALTAVLTLGTPRVDAQVGPQLVPLPGVPALTLIYADAEGIGMVRLTPHGPNPASDGTAIAAEFDIGPPARSFQGTRDRFKSYFIDQAVDQDKTVVLLLDEAQTLKPPLLELLRQFANYETNDQTLFQLVPFAQR